MTCRFESSDPRKCDRCGSFLWVAQEGLFCGECGVTMPCTMRLLPAPPVGADARSGPIGIAPRVRERGTSETRRPSE